MDTAILHALRQTWPPFVLVAGLLLIGAVAATDRLFEGAGTWLARVPGSGLVLFGSLMGLVAAVTVVLNLDTSVVFLTPVMLHAARRRDLPEKAFLYGTVFMSNAASLLLPGSNLTNLLVLAGRQGGGSRFAAAMFPVWITSVVLCGLVVGVWRRRDLRARGRRSSGSVPGRIGFGALGVVLAVLLVLGLRAPALPVLAVGVGCAAGQLVTRRASLSPLRRAVNPVLLGPLFVLATGLGTLARLWGAPARLMSDLGGPATSLLGVAAASLLNNLPATMLLSSHVPAHPRALLLGLDLGPNLVVTGALSALLWLRVSRAEGAEPSVVTYSRVGVVVVLVTVGAGLAVLRW